MTDPIERKITFLVMPSVTDEEYVRAGGGMPLHDQRPNLQADFERVRTSRLGFLVKTALTQAEMPSIWLIPTQSYAGPEALEQTARTLAASLGRRASETSVIVDPEMSIRSCESTFGFSHLDGAISHVGVCVTHSNLYGLSRTLGFKIDNGLLNKGSVVTLVVKTDGTDGTWGRLIKGSGHIMKGTPVPEQIGQRALAGKTPQQGLSR